VTAVQADDSEGDREAYARGLNRGWDHANFCEAYAPEETDLVPTDVDGPHQLSYQAGWREGVRRYLANQWQDGKPRDAG
jgi:hypothetical protein